MPLNSIYPLLWHNHHFSSPLLWHNRHFSATREEHEAFYYAYYGAILKVSDKLPLSSLHVKIHDHSCNSLLNPLAVGFFQFISTCMHLWHYVSHDMVMRPLVAVASIQSHAFHSCMHVCTALYMFELILNFVRLSWIHTREVNYLNFMGM